MKINSKNRERRKIPGTRIKITRKKIGERKETQRNDRNAQKTKRKGENRAYRKNRSIRETKGFAERESRLEWMRAKKM
jgi:hypothetical protein